MQVFCLHFQLGPKQSAFLCPITSQITGSWKLYFIGSSTAIVFVSNPWTVVLLLWTSIGFMFLLLAHLALSCKICKDNLIFRYSYSTRLRRILTPQLVHGIFKMIQFHSSHMSCCCQGKKVWYFQERLQRLSQLHSFLPYLREPQNMHALKGRVL